MKQKVLIVGGVAGGATAAARLRRLDEEAEILLFEREEYISFANCGLPYYIGGSIRQRSRLLVQTSEAMRSRFRIDVRTESEVVAVDTAAKKVTVNSREKGVYEESYDQLILSPGARAIRPSIPGIESEKIFTLRNIPDTDAIKAYVDREGIQSAVVIGGGFVGVEMAENLRERGLSVTLVEALPHILSPFDADMATLAEKELAENGVELVLGDGVASFREAGGQIQATLQSGAALTADLVILAIGVTPDTNFLQGSGIALGPKGHIVVNQHMQASAPSVYAVGDAVEVLDFVTGRKTAVPLAGPANKQGRIAADNIAGIPSTYTGTQGTAIVKLFSLTAAVTGANEQALRAAGMPYHKIYVHPLSHASYYPGALPMSLKLLFGEDGRVLGAQGVGLDGVDKRIDVIATVIRLKGSVQDLTELELAYAPPFSSAKDPVNMAGYVAENVLAGRSHMVAWQDMADSPVQDAILLDVRTKEEFDNGHLEGAINIPVDSLRERLSELDPSKPIVEYCQVGLRGYIADRILTQNGFTVQNVTGGYKTSSQAEPAPKQAATPCGMPVSIDPETQVMREESPEAGYHQSLDARGLCCPGPLMQVKTALDELTDGQILRVTASDPGFYEDIQAWCRRTGNGLLERAKEGGQITALIQKNTGSQPAGGTAGDNKTIVVFSGDLDKAIASFIIANGAASMGRKVTMFFTFWGLNILRKPEKVKVKKPFMESMFGKMMPRGSGKLSLSRMNMLGMGGKMIRKVMRDKNVSSLEELIQSAMQSGIEIVACQMSMDVMGLRLEELIDGVKAGGVGYYLGEAEDSNVNLFI